MTSATPLAGGDRIKVVIFFSSFGWNNIFWCDSNINCLGWYLYNEKG